MCASACVEVGGKEEKDSQGRMGRRGGGRENPFYQREAEDNVYYRKGEIRMFLGEYRGPKDPKDPSSD